MLNSEFVMTIAHVLATGVAPRPNAPRAIYRIVVRDLLLMCRIGIYEHERLAPQRVRINVDLAVSETVGDTGDDIANVYNYEEVINGTKAVISSGHIDLVETLAEEIAAHCLKDARVEDVRVRVEKLDVYAEGGKRRHRNRASSIQRPPHRGRQSASRCRSGRRNQIGRLHVGWEWLRPWLDQVATQPVLIVPGGGPFADCVRKIQGQVGFSDSAAHKMALNAMVQFGIMVIDMEPRLQGVSTLAEISKVLAQGRPAVWLPVAVTNHPEIPQSWSVTSDSLAAWLAAQVDAKRLILVKSTALPGVPTPVELLVADGIVDAAFPKFVGRLTAELVEARDAQVTMDAIQNNRPVGTKVVVR